MAPRDHNRFWRRCRIYFRRFRIVVWSIVLALLCCVLYLNRIGLPDFIKRPLVEKLHAHGLDLEFTRMRWRLNHGIVAENVRFGRANEPLIPVFTVKEAQVQLDYWQLARLRLQINGLVLHQGDLSWLVGGTNEPGSQLSFQQIETELHLLPGDLWKLNNLQAEFAGAKLELGGVVTNASAIREWKALHRRQPTAPGNVEKRLRQLADTLARIHFATPPELKLNLEGDARDLQSFTLRLNLNTPDAETPWGDIQQAFLSVVLLPGSTNILSHAELNLEAVSARTPWAATTNLNLKLNLVSSQPNTNLVHAELNLSAASLETKWSRATNARISAEWMQAMTNAIPISGHGEVWVNNASSQWGNVRQLRFASHFETTTNQPAPLEESWAWWTNLAPYTLQWEGELHDLQSPKLAAQNFFCAGNWNAPELTLTRISSSLYGGKLDAQAGVDVGTRVFNFKGAADFDVQKISPLLTEKSRQWIQQFSWKQSPKLEAGGSLLLPEWTNFAHAEWHDKVRPSMRLDGYVDAGEGSFRGVRFSSAHSHFSYSNMFWRLPDLLARRPEGEVRLSHISNEATRDYYFKVYSTIHPDAFKPLLAANQQRIFEIVGFKEPPVIDGEIWGRWYDHQRIGARARLAVTNFTVRGETFGDASAMLEYTNLFLKVIQPRAHRGGEYASATSLEFDIPARKIYITNAFGVADPGVVVRAIGPKIARHMEPYHFLKPVTARVNGVIPMRDERDADLHFELDGGPFEWWKFKVAHIAGRVDWVGQNLKLAQLKADFYHGSASGDAEFGFHHEAGTEFRFDVAALDADLHLLMNNLAEKTNHLEGFLNTHVTVTYGNSSDLHSLQGGGKVELRDGLIWDIPVFGILSPMLDNLAPGMGLGSSRAREGSASFTITNGVVESDDLEIRASMMRLQYRGTVDLVGSRLDARAQAELFRDTWVVGRILSYTLWPVSKIFEYKFTGTLHKPKSEPVFFVPKVLLFPFHPLRTLKDLTPEEPGATNEIKGTIP